MEANRLEALKQKYADKGWYRADADEVRETLTHIDQQQAEIERLNRAYEVLRKAAVYYSDEERFEVRHEFGFSEMDSDAGQLAREAISEAQRIKEGDGEQG